MNFGNLLFILYSIFIVGLFVRIISRRRPVSVSLAWILILFFIPIAGPILYFLLGELHLSRKKIDLQDARYKALASQLTELSLKYGDAFTRLSGASLSMAHFLNNIKNSPPLTGNKLEIFDDALEVLDMFIGEVKNAKHSCHLLFYIYANGGKVDELSEALIEAAHRGVVVRLLVDAVGSSEFVGSEMFYRMQKAGVQINVALEVGLIRMWFQRIDIRNHRKIFVVDNHLGFTGSQNIADPRTFKKDSKVGQWIDSTVRIEGPAVEALNITFFSDWCYETDEDLNDYLPKLKSHYEAAPGEAITQLVPSGPGLKTNAIHEILLAAIYAAREEIVITTPYFVPTDTFVFALKTASLSGVRVTVVVPEKSDSPLVRIASHSIFEDLLQAGVIIKSFHGGLLHSKTVTVDGTIALVGSVNMDMRSFYINFEVSLFCYDTQFTRQLRLLQASYYPDSIDLSPERLAARAPLIRLRDDMARLLSPLL